MDSVQSKSQQPTKEYQSDRIQGYGSAFTPKPDLFVGKLMILNEKECWRIKYKGQ
ncbi:MULTISPECIES: hypothetical protein [Nostocales]|uniref:Uncharacterized protein n=3 Tax=Nostocales TaxID=1161 RepID=A0A8S9T9H4_9CYAN|nr:hypothetical protein [Tolypothrix bouteillei]KAF3888274.1 hypothetical protein DA73_0400024365 [Tolypothrix bouteillei VB521301]